MQLKLFQVDAFTGKLFSGNPAAVCPLQDWLPDHLMQGIATENNLSETAFFCGSQGHYDLRWFTPTTEVQLCGHATLATAFVLWKCLEETSPVLEFQTRSGPLFVEQDRDLLAMSFPRALPAPCPPADLVISAIGKKPKELWQHTEGNNQGNYLLVYEKESEILELRPDFKALSQIPDMGVIVSAPSQRADFVSRYFAPAFGINEDPVTGSIHCLLTPYWAARLSRKRLQALQVSARGGELQCEEKGDRVLISGRAVLYLEGTIMVPDVTQDTAG